MEMLKRLREWLIAIIIAFLICNLFVFLYYRPTGWINRSNSATNSEYGRRRVGKTFLLREFANCHNSIFLCTRKNDRLNLEDFSKTVLSHFGEDYLVAFQNWEVVFSYIGKQDTEKKIFC